MKFNAMFQPIEIGPMTVKNRFVVPPMGNNFANTDGTMSEQYLLCVIICMFCSILDTFFKVCIADNLYADGIWSDAFFFDHFYERYWKRFGRKYCN